MTPQEKMQSIISNATRQMPQVLEQINSEFARRKDCIIKPSAIKFWYGDSATAFIQDEELNFTRHSETQLFERLGIPYTYVKKLKKLEERDLLVENMTRMNDRLNSEGVLVRQVDKTIKGFLSPSYKRMDASPIFQGFIETAVKMGFAPQRAINTDSRVNISFIYPELFELAPSEYVAYGMSLTTSDYGSSALLVDMNILRIVCSNLAVGYDMLRKVHLGARFSSEGDIQVLSGKTLELDTATITSAISDIVASAPKHIEHLNSMVTAKMDKAINVKEAIAAMKKRGVSSDVAEQVRTTYDTDMPVEALPPMQGAWRFSNVLSLIANGQNGDDKLQLEREAMAVLVN